MLASLRRSYVQLITSGAQLLLLLVGFRLESRSGWLYCLTLMAIISVFAWLSSLNRLRAIRDTPTSKIASAAQGYVELAGRGEPFGEPPLLSQLRRLPCLWYRYKVERRTSRNKWVTEDSGESQDSFQLRDDSGLCVVDPEQAEITTQHRDRWHEGNHRYTEWKLIKNDNIYVLGEFRTQSGMIESASRADLGALLAEWKKDMPALHQRFDLNKDGELSMDEWLLARQAAKRELAITQQQAGALSDMHIIGMPRDGKLLLISNLNPEKLSRRYLLWAWAHLTLFFGALGGIGRVLQSSIF
ncbi:MAG: hypothetical protein Q7U37_02920 [Gallionella sp.]|nr:hypothetical protein [Gallionella sp.]